MDAVDANEAHSPAGVGRASLANGIEHGPGFGQGHPGGFVWAALAQVVQVRGRQLRQAFKARITVHMPGAAQQVHRRRPRQAAMGAINAHQQRHIGGAVAPGKGMRWHAVALGQRLAFQHARQQPRQLRARVAAGARQIAQHDALVGPGQTRIAQAAHHAGNVRIALLIIGEGAEADLQRAFEKRLQLGNAAQPGFVHVDHHLKNDRPRSPIQAHISLESRQLVQAHTSLDKTLVCQRRPVPI
ncbi:hypothetical protein ACFSTJ_05140 [Ottowia pentelensis]|uniref:hypothetical protein n=1 Tax=Ottowia pentelensis TaxID=511108 RepID=UPI00363F84EE